MNQTVLLEEWRDIKGYEGSYMVSNLGRIKSLVGWNGYEYIKRDKILNPYKQKVGQDYYRSVVKLHKNGKKKDAKVHRLVASAFIPNPENKPNINHKDGNPLNNIVSNLEWCTQRENIIHSYEIGLKPTFQISKDELYDLYVKKRKSITEIANIKNTTHTIIRNRMNTLGIKPRSSSESKRKYKINKEILEKELKNKTQKEVADDIGCSQSLISHYLKRIKEKGRIYA